jgi:hypothetical protein
MDQRKIWKKYITAQTKILEHKSKPIGVDTSKVCELEGQELKVSVDQEIFKNVFKAEIERVFKIKDFDFEDNYILKNLDEIPEADLKAVKELAEDSYIDFNENPVIDGEISVLDESFLIELKKIIGKLPNTYQFKNSGLIFLTIN